ncbi:MAG: FixH family protein [Sulfuricurvum sp.]|nr:FixH family protein [Sulfuricurvum sp.]MDP3023053.1 FixH family protein [Sulfuricurvum sp.]MDP3119162.1 FixH family protein [Sulfuricurvum sp.]
MINKDAGKKWPWIISISIIIVIGFSVATIKVALNNPVEMSGYGMQNYHEYDKNVNEIINAKIEFDKKYSITFLTPQISDKKSVIAYTIKDKSGNPIEDANLSVVLTRPDTTKLDITLDKPVIKNGVYTFKAIDLPKAGRWDIMAKITIGEDQRYYNLKADTRNPNTFEF